MKKSALIAPVAGAAVGAAAVTVGPRYLEHLPFLTADAELLHWKPLWVASVLVWVVFGVYWKISERGAAGAIQSESAGSRAVHVVLANAALLMILAPVHGFGRALPAMPAMMTLGIFVETIGLALAIAARRALGRNWSGEIAIKEGHELIRTGPYARLRHPIYTGLLMMYAGTAIVSGEWLGAAGLALAFLAYARKIRLEEANLAAAFGPAYDAYRHESWALVPGVF